MKFPHPLENGLLIKRYKRFLADIELANGEIMTIHCANTGAMTGCAEPGNTVWFSRSDNPKRKYPCSWELSVTSAGHWIGVNTHMANKLVAEAIQNGTVTELQGYSDLRQEVKYGSENSRIDLLLSNGDADECYIEIKSVTLLHEGRGYFPDAVSTRGQKHLRELMEIVQQGKRAVLFFCVQHTGIENVEAARHVDPAYADLLEEAKTAGVEVLTYSCEISAESIELVRRLPA